MCFLRLKFSFFFGFFVDFFVFFNVLANFSFLLRFFAGFLRQEIPLLMSQFLFYFLNGIFRFFLRVFGIYPSLGRFFLVTSIFCFHF